MVSALSWKVCQQSGCWDGVPEALRCFLEQKLEEIEAARNWVISQWIFIHNWVGLVWDASGFSALV
jgi:hypothetical protein